MFPGSTLRESSIYHNVTYTFSLIRVSLSKLFNRHFDVKMPKPNDTENHLHDTMDSQAIDSHISNQKKPQIWFISYLIRASKSANHFSRIATQRVTTNHNLSSRVRSPPPYISQSSPDVTGGLTQVFINSGSRRRGLTDRPQKNFVKCRLYLKDAKIRITFLACCISALFLMFLLCLYLMLSLSNQGQKQGLHIIFMITMLISTIFFCHTLIRLCLLIVESQNLERSGSGNLNMVESPECRNPVSPIPVFMAIDEECENIDNERTRVPPPAYGLWRESARMDPNQIFWQRNEISNHESLSQTGLRPPSYISVYELSSNSEAISRCLIPDRCLHHSTLQDNR